MLHKIKSEDLSNKESLFYKVSLYIMAKEDWSVPTEPSPEFSRLF